MEQTKNAGQISTRSELRENTSYFPQIGTRGTEDLPTVIDPSAALGRLVGVAQPMHLLSWCHPAFRCLCGVTFQADRR